MECFDPLRLAMFSGKGGVGKTTLSCGLACYWAQKFPDEQILLLSTDPAHSLGDVLQVEVDDVARSLASLPNLKVRALDAKRLLQAFKERYGRVLELLVERGSFVEGEDLTPVWDLDWPGLDELMGLLEIQRLFNQQGASRIVVDMAPSGHTLNLFELMDFLDQFLHSLELFQQKYRFICQSFAGHYTPDEADDFLQTLKDELASGRHLLQNSAQTACLVVAIAEPMSWLETKRFWAALQTLQVPCGGLLINQIITGTTDLDRYQEQQTLIDQFLSLTNQKPILLVPQQNEEPLGITALNRLLNQICSPKHDPRPPVAVSIQWPEKIPPGFNDFLSVGRRLLLVGGKGGVGKTTVAAAIGWAMAQQHPSRQIRLVSIDPAHSLGDAFGLTLAHEPQAILPNLRGQEVDAEQVLNQFRADYLWELAEMMSGKTPDDASAMELAYAPVAWRKIVDQALPGIDEILSLLTVIELLEQEKEDLIILDTAPTGHLLRFLEMPTALADWLAWIFKLWIKYQSILGRTEFMGRLRSLRQRVVKAQKILKDSQQTEFVGVILAQKGVVAEAQRLSRSLEQMGVAQNYVVLNRFTSGSTVNPEQFPGVSIVHLPKLPRSVKPVERIQGAATCLF